MRILFLFGNMIGLLGVIALAYMNISFSPSPSDPVLKNTPVPENFNNIEIEKNLKKHDDDFSILWDANVFSQFRAKENGENFSTKSNNFELLGVILYGENSGAIIIDKGTSVSSSPTTVKQLSNNRQNESQSAQDKAPQFYKLNEILPNGFILREINHNSVTLIRGREQIVLQLDFDDEGSKMRTNEARKISSSYSGQEGENAKAKEQSQNNVIIFPPRGQNLQPKTIKEDDDKPENKKNEDDDRNNTQNTIMLKRTNNSIRKPGEISK
ncbi:MAG TPA: hypothetical protein P5270_01825 [Victivallales bacterium]|nr:hypothetical protein [Victivallales bacterium]HRR28077.1 hypothetical protein [Victivallales bacterium]HRU02012.1 hypothetical protein [Victivallales bacterium]